MRSAFGGGRQIAVQAPGDDVFGPDIVMSGHDEMRQHWLGLEGRSFDAARFELGELPLDTVRPEFAKNIELSPA